MNHLLVQGTDDWLISKAQSPGESRSAQSRDQLFLFPPMLILNS